MYSTYRRTRMDLLWIMVWCTIMVSVVKFPSAVNSDPIKIDFNNCQPAAYQPSLANTTADTPFDLMQCCPTPPTRPIIDGLPAPTTKFTRVRKASQCTDAAYAAKLHKAYELLRALPDDDPRSFTQQRTLHCSYCGGSFYSTNNGKTTDIGVDVHWSWLFYPWHRYFLYFHERILQSLLGDPTFSLNFWNWDNPFTVGNGDIDTDGPVCLKSGHDFPSALYGKKSTSTFDSNRSENALGKGRLPFPDLTFSVILPAVDQPLYNASADDLIKSNLNVMYQAMVSGGTTAVTFMGLPQRVGDQRGNPMRGAGSLEATAHTTVHSWIGKDPYDFVDMGTIPFAARDPVFYAHHANVDRLFQVWKDIGPVLGQKRDYSSDPDFLNAEFLFYDENADLRRVKVADSLDTTKLGYTYQGANDAAWLFLNQTRCSTTSHSELIAQTERLPVPSKDGKGYYHLRCGEPLVMVLDRPENPNGEEEFLTISGIKMNRYRNGGFDVYLELPYPSNCTYPSQCAEYTGGLTNMAQGRHTFENTQGVWKQSISRTLIDIQVPPSSSKLVVTLVPLARWGGSRATIQFSSIAIETS